MSARVALLLLLASACEPTRVYGACDVDAVVDAVDDALVRWPDLKRTAVPLMVLCQAPRKLATTCRSEAAESCALWGASLGHPARIALREHAGDETAALVEHELQHLRPGLPDMCRTHSPDCWEE